MLSQASDQNITNSAVLTDSNTMIFATSSSTHYRIRGQIFLDTTAIGDIKYGFAHTGTTTRIRMARVSGAPSGTPAEVATDTSIPTNATILSSTTSGAVIRFDCVLQVGASGGNFSFQFAQNTQTNDAGVTVLAGSYMEYSVA